MKDFQRDLDRDHVPRDSNREPRAHVSDAIQIAKPAPVQAMSGPIGKWMDVRMYFFTTLLPYVRAYKQLTRAV